jgi:drug/metabolite transporter (DMT)-like permease
VPALKLILKRFVGKLYAFPESAVFLAVFAWSFGPIFMNAVDVSVNSLIFYRAIFWPPVLYMIMRARKISVTMPVMKIAFVPGVFFGLATIVGFISLRTTSIANATIIGNVSTALVLFVAPRFLNESINRKQVFFALLSFAGVAAVAFGAGNTGGATLTGDAYGLANAVLWTGFYVSSKRARADGVSTWGFMFGVSVAQVCVVTPWVLATSNDLGALSLRDFVLILSLVIAVGTTGHTLLVWAQGHVEATTSSLICLLVPVGSMIAAWIFFRQGVTIIQLLGGAVVLASLAGVVRYGASGSTKRASLIVVDPLIN